MTSLQLYLKLLQLKLKVCLQDHNLDVLKIVTIQCNEIIIPSQEEFAKFFQHTNQNSELCRFLQLLKINTKYLKDLIAADCSCNWHAHLQSVKKLLHFLEE